MPLDTAVNHGRPTRTYDQGGWVESLDSKTQLFVALELWDNTLNMTFRQEEDVRVGDLIEVPYDT